MHFTESAAQRLSIEAVLRGHHGCVNRLCWNEGGSLLGSGSDDRRVLLWRYPDTQRQPLCIDTQHQANIFGVRFLPQTGDARLVTGAMDYTVQLHALEAPPAQQQTPLRSAAPTRRQPNTAVTPAAAHTTVYTCHRSRVKDVAVEPLNPHLFWSAGEDGAVRQFDTRTPTAQQRDFDSPNLLLAVKHKGRFSELKSLNLNPARPHQLGVAAADPFLRLYDRRMLSPGRPGSRSSEARPALELAPPHLALAAAAGGGGRGARLHATYLAFGSRGDKVVATYHGDHAYCFDVTGAAPAHGGGSSAAAEAGGREHGPLDLFAGAAAAAALASSNGARARRGRGSSVGSGGGASGSGGGGGGMADLPGMLPAAAERAKADGNLALFSRQYYEAVQRYSEAIRLAPWAPILYTNRALALLQRGWEGDALCALRDAETAVCLDPAWPKAHYRRLQALRGAGMLQSAAIALRLFKRHFAHQAEEVEGLEEQLAADHQRQAQVAELAAQQAEQRRQLRRRRGQQFDRQQRQRRQERAAAGAGEGGAAGEAQAGAAEAPRAEAAAEAAAGAQEETGEAGGPGQGAAAPPGQPQAGGDEWDELYASESFESDEEDAAAGGGGTSGGTGASSWVDAQYAAALEAAAEGTTSAGEAAAAPAAPAIDAIAGTAAARAGGPRRAVQPPSLWHAFEGGRRFLQRFVGQLNLQTDIKEACFLGADDGLVAAGSDDGRVFVFDAASGQCVRVIMADEDVANAVQPHPHLPVLATSGIESTVKLWSPEGEPTTGGNLPEVIRRNQERLKEGPTVLRGMDPRLIAALTDNPELLRALMQRATRRPAAGAAASGSGSDAGSDGEEGEEEEEGGVREVSCRVA